MALYDVYHGQYVPQMVRELAGITPVKTIEVGNGWEAIVRVGDELGIDYDQLYAISHPKEENPI